MMEEVADDTNGESTFEFVEGKTDESLVQSDSTAVSTSDQISASISMQTSTHEETSASLVTSSDTLPPPQPAPYFPAVPQAIESTSSSSSPPLYYSSPLSLPDAPIYSPSPSSIMTPVATITQPTSVVSIPSATVDLPIEDSLAAMKITQPEGNGMWGWLTGSELLNKVAEKAKNSVDSVIATLDPGMKEIIYSGGDISIIVASDKEVKVSPIREAFQYVFGRATVHGIAAQSCNIAAQPVGFATGLKAAEERISFLRQQGSIHQFQPVVAIENFLAELTPDRWYDIGCLVLQDPYNSITLHVYTQATPVPTEYVVQAQEQTPQDYPLRWSGLSVTIGQVMNSILGIPHTEWHKGLVGIPRREMVLLAAKSLAGMYKNYLNR